MLKYVSHSPEQTYQLGEALGRMALPGDLYCINGELGTGKTVFARGLAAGLGVQSRVTSPTFTLIHEHLGNLPFYHMDVYRLNSAEDMYDLGYEDYFYGQGVTLVEWAEIVKDILPDQRLDITLTHIGENGRQMDFLPLGKRYQRLLEELSILVRTGD